MRQSIVEHGAKLGYNESYRVHHTPDYSVPKNRDRVVFVGMRHDVGGPADFYRELETHRAAPATARETILSAGRYDTKANPRTCTAAVTLAANPVTRRSPYAGMMVNGAGRPIDLDGIAPTLPAAMGGNKTPTMDEAAPRDPSIPNRFETYHQSFLDGTASPGPGAFPQTVRRLTLKECAAIQTFPAGYRFSGCKTKQHKQIGNAMPRRFAHTVAMSVRDAYLGGS